MEWLGFDFETREITPGVLAPRPVCFSLAGFSEAPNYLPRDADSWWRSTDHGWEAVFHIRHAAQVFGNLFGDTNIGLVAHNKPFDAGVLLNWLPQFTEPVLNMIEQGRLRDTLVRDKLIQIANGTLKFDKNNKKMSYSLAAVVLRYFNKDISESKKGSSWRYRYQSLEDVPFQNWPEAALIYSAQDSTWALRCFREQRRAKGFVQYFNGQEYQLYDTAADVVNDELPQTKAAMSLHLMAMFGVCTDSLAVQEFEARVTNKASECAKAGERAGFIRIDGTKDMKVLRGLVAEAYRDNPPLTQKGSIKTDSKTLLESGHSDLVEYAQGSGAQKLLNTYLPILKSGTQHAITSRPNVLVRSGRTSWERPNFQNPPREGGFRECFIPAKDFVFCAVDYSSIELRALAQVQLTWFGESRLAEAFQDGLDPHLWFGAKLLGMDYKEALDHYKDQGSPMHKEVKRKRSLAKVANFGYPGGLSARTFVQYCVGYGVHISNFEAAELQQEWLNTWDLGRYFNNIRHWTKLGSSTIVQHASNRIRGDVTYTSACNTFFQGLTADGIKAAMWRLTKACYLNEGNFHTVNPWVMIHDEIIAEGPERTAHLWGPDMAKIMIEEMQKFIPDIPIEAEPALMRRWYKDAQPVFKKGKLSVWEPQNVRTKFVEIGKRPPS